MDSPCHGQSNGKSILLFTRYQAETEYASVFGRAQIRCVSQCAHNRLGLGNFFRVFRAARSLYGTGCGDGMSGWAFAGTNLPAETQQKDDCQDDHPVENAKFGHERVSLGLGESNFATVE